MQLLKAAFSVAVAFAAGYSGLLSYPLMIPYTSFCLRSRAISVADCAKCVQLNLVIVIVVELILHDPYLLLQPSVIVLSQTVWVTLWWENGSHHYRATHLSGYVIGLGLSRLCITPSTRLKDLRSTALETSTITYQSSSHLFPSSLFCFLGLANQLSRSGYSLPTLLETKPQFS
jgi:hypothetical protein